MHWISHVHIDPVLTTLFDTQMYHNIHPVMYQLHLNCQYRNSPVFAPHPYAQRKIYTHFTCAVPVGAGAWRVRAFLDPLKHPKTPQKHSFLTLFGSILTIPRPPSHGPKTHPKTPCLYTTSNYLQNTIPDLNNPKYQNYHFSVHRSKSSKTRF